MTDFDFSAKSSASKSPKHRPNSNTTIWLILGSVLGVVAIVSVLLIIRDSFASQNLTKSEAKAWQQFMRGDGSRFVGLFMTAAYENGSWSIWGSDLEGNVANPVENSGGIAGWDYRPEFAEATPKEEAINSAKEFSFGFQAAAVLSFRDNGPALEAYFRDGKPSKPTASEEQELKSFFRKMTQNLH